MTKLLSNPKADSKKQTVILMSDSKDIVLVDGKPCRLTFQELRLLKALVSQAGAVLSREWLLCQAWDYLSPGKSRTVDVHVQRLRRKMGSSLFETVHGQGYKLLATPVKP